MGEVSCIAHATKSDVITINVLFFFFSRQRQAPGADSEVRDRVLISEITAATLGYVAPDIDF